MSKPYSPRHRHGCIQPAAFVITERLERRTLFAAVPFTTQNLTTSADGAHGVFVIDVDKDGFDDVLAAVETDNTVLWFRSNGAGGGFTSRTITTSAPEVGGVSAVDLDQDGDIDILAAAKTGHLMWFENNGSNQFTSRNVSATAVGANAVMAGDLDGDGDIDLAADNASGNKLVWYENNGSESFTERTILNDAGVVKSVFVIDIDNDDDLDIISGSEQSDSVILYLNNGSGVFTSRNVDTSMDFCLSVCVADINGDGDIDVLATSLQGDTVAWYENDGSENFTKRVIASDADGASGVFVADIDDDGDMDVLASNFVDDRIVWYDNLNGNALSWTPRTITSVADRAQDVATGDFDGDGDLDVASASYRDNKVTVYVSGLATSPPTSPPPTSPPPTSPPPTSPPPTSPPPTSPPAAIAATATGKLPASAVAGGKAKANVTVSVGNGTGQLVNTPVTVRLFASADDVLDGGDVELATVTKKLKIATGTSKNVKLAFKSFPATLVDGTYKVVAEVTPAGGSAVTTATAATTLVAAPFVNLAGTGVAPAAIKLGKNGRFVLTLSNSGNVKLGPATASVTVEAALGGNLAARVPVAVVTPKFNIQPGKTKKLTLKFAVPDTIAPGSYTLVATLDSGSAIVESDENDNQIVSASASELQ